MLSVQKATQQVRRIVDNVQKGLVFLISTHVAFLGFILVSTLFVAERQVGRSVGMVVREGRRNRIEAGGKQGVEEA